MADFGELALIIIGTTLILALFIFIAVFVVYLITVNITEKNIVNVYVDGQLIFGGKKAFVDVTSGGYTTTVTIYSKLFPFQIINKTFTSKDVVVK